MTIMAVAPDRVARRSRPEHANASADGEGAEARGKKLKFGLNSFGASHEDSDGVTTLSLSASKGMLSCPAVRGPCSRFRPHLVNGSDCGAARPPQAI
jgi:hypothetical protein